MEEQNAELAVSPKAFREFVGGLRSNRRGTRKLLRRSFGGAVDDPLDVDHLDRLDRDERLDRLDRSVPANDDKMRSSSGPELQRRGFLPRFPPPPKPVK